MKKSHIIATILIFSILACKNNNSSQNVTTSDKNEAGSISIDGSTLEYSIKGKGAPFLLIGSDHDFFSEDLYNNFRVYSIQTRLNAKDYQPVDTTKYNHNSLLKDIDTLRSILGLEKFIIGGHSVMGAIAHRYTQKHPEHVTHIIMMATPRTWGTTAYSDSRKLYWEENASEKRKTLYSNNLKQLQEGNKDTLSQRQAYIKRMVASSPIRWHDPNMDATAIFERTAFNLNFASHLFGKVLTTYNLCDPDQKLDIPAFVAVGKSDYIAPPTLWDLECKKSPNLTISLFEESGHTPQYEESELFNKRLVEWVREN